MDALADLLPGVPTQTRQTCASGDACALVVRQLPPVSAADVDLITADVYAEFDNDSRHRVGTLHAHPRPGAGMRVLGTVCIPGARAYFVTWRLTSSREIPAGVGIHQSIGGADYGLRNLDLRDAEDSESLWIPSPGAATSLLVSPSACVVAEVYGFATATATIVQLHDAAAVAPGDVPEDEWRVPADGTYHRTFPPRIFRRGLIVARSSTLGSFTADGSGNVAARARILVR